MTKKDKTIIIAGIARSGMTLMTQMLYKGGYPCYKKWPDFEGQRGEMICWDDLKGLAVKLVNTYERFPPPIMDYYVIRMRRNIREQAKSHIKFGASKEGKKPKYEWKAIMDIESVIKYFYHHIDAWALRQINTITVDFEDLLSDPKYIIQFIEERWNLGIDIDAAVSAVIPRGPENFNGILEKTFLIKNHSK